MIIDLVSETLSVNHNIWFLFVYIMLKKTRKDENFGVIFNNLSIIGTSSSVLKTPSLPKSSEQSEQARIGDLIDLLEL